jgi:hypothetical protein
VDNKNAFSDFSSKSGSTGTRTGTHLGSTQSSSNALLVNPVEIGIFEHLQSRCTAAARTVRLEGKEDR